MSNLLIKSLNLGIIDSALNWLIGALTTLFQWIINFAIDLIVLIFAEILYAIGLTLLSLVDFFQAFFNALCGLGTHYYNGIAYNDDPILRLITNKAVLQVFLALTIVAVIMLILTTIIAMIRTEYTTEGAKNTKGNIIGSALKSLAMFFIVPAACVLGIILSSGLLKAVYNATSGGDNVTAGAMVWYASSYNANRVRLQKEGITIASLITFYDDHWNDGAPKTNDKLSADFTATGGTPADRREAIALAIDNAFKNRTPIGNGDKALGAVESYTFTDLMRGEMDATPRYSYRSVPITEVYYSIRSMNFITMYLGGGIALYIMFIAAFGLIIRLYKCAILFMISAPITALTPLDGGSAYKNWRKLMIGSVCAAFSVVIAFNLVFLLIPIVSNINIFNPNGGMAVLATPWNRLVSLIFVLTGLYTIKETSKWVASMLGIEDPLAAGGEIAGKVMGTVGKIGTVAGGTVAGVATKAIGAGMRRSADKALSQAMVHDKDGKIRLDADGNPMVKKGHEADAAKAVNLSKKADKVTGVGSKFTGAGSSVIGKTISKNFTRFDDFVGGANVFGGAEGEGVGGFLNKKATGLYDKGVNKVSGIGGMSKLDKAEYEANEKKIERIKNKKTKTKDDEERLEQLQEQQKVLKDKSRYATGGNKASLYASRIDAEAATFTKTQKQAQEFGESVEKNVGDALRAAAMYGGVNTAKGQEAAKGPIEELAKKLNMTFDQIVKKLETTAGQQELKNNGHAALKILNDYAGKVDVNVSGFDPSKLSGMDSLAPTEFKTAEATLKNMLEAQGVSGSNLQEQFEKNLKAIKDEQKKVAEEVKKETDKMLQQATLIAKQMKKLNPSKK